jgi:putative membrane protein
MKQLNYLKQTWIHVAFVAAILFMASCSDTTKAEDTKDVAEEQNDDAFDNNKQEKDAQFLVNAAEMDMEAIKLGQLAAQNGRSARAKDLGKMMEDAHTKSLQELTDLAKAKSITIPSSLTDNGQDAFSSLKEKTGNDFDQAYADMMVDKHDDAIDTYEIASNSSQDTDIKNWAAASLPGLRKHLDHSMDCQKQFADMYLKENKK